MTHFVRTASRLGYPVHFVDLGRQIERRWSFSIPTDRTSWLTDECGARRELDPHGAYYCRLADLGNQLPDHKAEWRACVEGWDQWLRMCPGVVVNRPDHSMDNGSKPLHESVLTNLGFIVPDSLTTCSRGKILEFLNKGPCIAKAVSGCRADCRLVSVNDFDGYEDCSGPVHLQRYVDGMDVRAHVIGTQVFAVAARSDNVDYRLDSGTTFEAIALSPGLADQLIDATCHLGLAFAGWDLRTDGNTTWVFEANPMPGYRYYDQHVDGAITKGLAEYLLSRCGLS